jgi:hypothetical protein
LYDDNSEYNVKVPAVKINSKNAISPGEVKMRIIAFKISLESSMSLFNLNI